LKEEALDRPIWRIRFGRGYGPLVKETMWWWWLWWLLWTRDLSFASSMQYTISHTKTILVIFTHLVRSPERSNLEALPPTF